MIAADPDLRWRENGSATGRGPLPHETPRSVWSPGRAQDVFWLRVPELDTGTRHVTGA